MTDQNHLGKASKSELFFISIEVSPSVPSSNVLIDYFWLHCVIFRGANRLGSSRTSTASQRSPENGLRNVARGFSPFTWLRSSPSHSEYSEFSLDAYIVLDMSYDVG